MLANLLLMADRAYMYSAPLTFSTKQKNLTNWSSLRGDQVTTKRVVSLLIAEPSFFQVMRAKMFSAASKYARISPMLFLSAARKGIELRKSQIAGCAEQM
jgi:hypothetical protein